MFVGIAARVTPPMLGIAARVTPPTPQPGYYERTLMTDTSDTDTDTSYLSDDQLDQQQPDMLRFLQELGWVEPETDLNPNSSLSP